MAYLNFTRTEMHNECKATYLIRMIFFENSSLFMSLLSIYCVSLRP